MMPATGAMSWMKLKLRFVVERRIDRIRRSDLKEGVAIGVRPDDNLGSKIAPSSRSVVDDKLLPELLRKRLSNQARDNVCRGPGGEADNEADRSRRIIKRTCNARHGRERGSARCQMEKMSAGKFQGLASGMLRLPSWVTACDHWSEGAMSARRSAPAGDRLALLGASEKDCGRPTLLMQNQS
jgi:hypothetical protein